VAVRAAVVVAAAAVARAPARVRPRLLPTLRARRATRPARTAGTTRRPSRRSSAEQARPVLGRGLQQAAAATARPPPLVLFGEMTRALIGDLDALLKRPETFAGLRGRSMLRNRERIDRAVVDELTPALAQHVKRMFESRYGADARAEARRLLRRKKTQPLEMLDAGPLLQLMLRSWKAIAWGFERRLVEAVLEARNAHSHPSALRSDFGDDETDRILDAIEGLLRAISLPPGPKAGAMFDEQLAQEVLEASWPEATSLLWPAELSASFYTEGDGERRFRDLPLARSPTHSNMAWSA